MILFTLSHQTRLLNQWLPMNHTSQYLHHTSILRPWLCDLVWPMTNQQTWGKQRLEKCLSIGICPLRMLLPPCIPAGYSAGGSKWRRTRHPRQQMQVTTSHVSETLLDHPASVKLSDDNSCKRDCRQDQQKYHPADSSPSCRIISK